MKTNMDKDNDFVACTNCLTGKTQEIAFESGRIKHVIESENEQVGNLFVGTGLIDLQVNGITGIDFNSPALTRQDIINATYYLLSKGVTVFLPTLITNSDENICSIVHTIYETCQADPIVNNCIWGIHLEGPFISSTDGARGAHNEKYIKPPEWELFEKFQAAAGGKIKLITLAPELEGAISFIKKCVRHKILVSIGHSMADSEQINVAVEAGASMSTHLGNAVPLLLPRHPNTLWDQLAAEALYTCIIADGVHIPNSFIKVVIKSKAERTLLVSDATCFTGMPPGEYQNHIGSSVILNNEGRLSLKNTPGMLAGAAKSLLENVEYLIDQNLATLGESWKMASTNVARMIAGNDPAFYDGNNDLVIFELDGKKIQVKKVIKNGGIVFENLT